jgi:hypothetical protein
VSCCWMTPSTNSITGTDAGILTLKPGREHFRDAAFEPSPRLQSERSFRGKWRRR